MEMQESAAELMKRIDSAFQNVKMPAPHQLVEHDPREKRTTLKELEEPSIIENFGGKRHEEFEREINSMNVEEMFSMAPRAIHYYLPCFLKHLLKENDDFPFVLSMVSLFGIDRDHEGGKSQFWPDFTLDQLQVVLETIVYLLQHQKSYELDSVDGDSLELLKSAHKSWKRRTRECASKKK